MNKIFLFLSTFSLLASHSSIASFFCTSHSKNIKGVIFFNQKDAMVYSVSMSSTLNIFEATYKVFQATLKPSSNNQYVISGAAGENTIIELTMDSEDFSKMSNKPTSIAELSILFDDGSDDSDKKDITVLCESYSAANRDKEHKPK